MNKIEIKNVYHFGLTPAVIKSLFFINDSTIVYPSGSGIIVHNIATNTQRALPTISKGRGVTCMTYYESSQILAAGEKSDADRPFISIFDIDSSSMKRRKVLQTSQMQSDSFDSLSFSADGKYLAAVGSAPDFLVGIWIWDTKSQLHTKMKLSVNVTPVQLASLKTVYSVCFNPVDNQRFALFGKEMFKQQVIQGTNIVLHSKHTKDAFFNAWVVCMAWVNEDNYLIGLDSNVVQLFEGGELKQEFQVIYYSEIDKILGNLENPQEIAVRTLYVYEKGFICSCGRGKVHMFEKSDEKNEKYRKLREIDLEQKPSKEDSGGFSQLPFIISLSVSPSKRMFMCLTENAIVYEYDLYKDLKKDVKHKLVKVTPKVHTGSITGVDTCLRKPLVVTGSLDKNVLLWNYNTFKLELYKEFIEAVYSVALHPDGLYMLVGLEKSLKLMNIFVDEINVLKSFPVPNCRSCKFSNGGHLFAVANWNIVEVYSSITLQVQYRLRAHTDRVNALVWSKNDLRLVSVSEDGEIFNWDVLASKKVSENVQKYVHYYDVCIEGKSIFAVGSDFVVKELQESAIAKCVPAHNTQITRMVISNSERAMFMGLWTGAIRLYTYPLSEPYEWTEYRNHFAPITGLKVTFDDQYLISVSEDSVVILWEIIDKKMISKSKLENKFTAEVLADPVDLEDKNMLLKKFESKVEELKMENQFQLQSRDIKYTDNLNKVSKKLNDELEIMKSRNMEIEAENQATQNKVSQHLKDLVANMREECLQTELKNKDKLKVEAEKYQKLKELGTISQERFERQLEEMEKMQQNTIVQLMSVLSSIENSPPKPPPNPMEEWETEIGEMEDDTDFELIGRKDNFEQKFLKEENNIKDLEIEITSLKEQAKKLSVTTKNQRVMIQQKQTVINGLTDEIHQVDQAINQLKKLLQEKTEALDNRIKLEGELTEHNKELEKAKFVLDTKISALYKLYEPMNAEIKYLKLQIFGKEGDSNEQKKQMNVHRGLIFRGKEKLQALQEQEYNEKTKITTVKKKWNRLAGDLKKCEVLLNKPRMLKKAIRDIYKNTTEHQAETEAGDTGQVCGINPQREHLESMIDNLKSQMARNQMKYDNDDRSIMRQNILLMKEKNHLRRELKDTQMTINLMSEALELQKQYPKMPNKEFLAKMVYITQNAKMMKKLDKMSKELEENIVLINNLQHQNLNLKIREDTHLPMLPLSSTFVTLKNATKCQSLTSVFENKHFRTYSEVVKEETSNEQIITCQTEQKTFFEKMRNTYMRDTGSFEKTSDDPTDIKTSQLITKTFDSFGEL